MDGSNGNTRATSSDNEHVQTNAREVAHESTSPCARATGKPLRILNWNVEGLLSQVCEADFMQYVSAFDIICLTETFLERIQPLDCFPDFLQVFFPPPSVDAKPSRTK